MYRVTCTSSAINATRGRYSKPICASSGSHALIPKPATNGIAMNASRGHKRSHADTVTPVPAALTATGNERQNDPRYNGKEADHARGVEDVPLSDLYHHRNERRPRTERKH